MEKIILKALHAKNFASFADEVKFSTLTDVGKKEYPENTFAYNNEVFNKVSFLYGANGSGKSFFCRILAEIQRLIDLSPLSSMKNPQSLAQPFRAMDKPIPFFLYDTEYSNKPTFLGVDIVIDNITYHYELGTHDKKIVFELLTKKFLRTEKLLERRSASYKDIELRSELKSFDAIKHIVGEEALCLSMAAFLNNPLASQVARAINSINVISMTTAGLSPSKSQLTETQLAKYVNIFKNVDPTLRKMTYSFEEKETITQKIEFDDFDNREIIAKRMAIDIQAEHAVFENGKEVTSTTIDFFRDESLGTVKLFTLLPHLYDTLEYGGVLILDEIENGLHLSLAKELINLFINEESNKHNAQLICTSHQPLLVNGNVRRDQVWIVSKDNFGKNQLNRMSTMRTSRSTINLTNRLLEGAFGYNPNEIFKTDT